MKIFATNFTTAHHDRVLFSKHLVYVVWNAGMMPTPHDSRLKFGLSGVRTYDHPHASPEIYHRASDAEKDDVIFVTHQMYFLINKMQYTLC